MTLLGVLLWVAAILIALVPIVGLVAEFIDWYKDKMEQDYERYKDRDKEH